MTTESNRINVALIDLGKGFRGGQRQTLNLALALRLYRIPICVVCEPKGELIQRCKQDDIPTFNAHYNSISLGGTARRLKKHLHKEGVNIIHASDSHGHTLGSLIKMSDSEFKLIVTSRTCFGGSGYWSRKFKYGSADVSKFVAISKAVAKKLIEKGVSKKDIEIIYSSIDRDCFNTDDRTENDVFTIGTACSLEPGKGVDKILDAVSLMREKTRDFRLRIAGSGPDRDSYEQLVKKTGLMNIVEFTGFVDDIADFYKSLDVYILASESEGLGSSILEAGACGAVPIGTKSGGIVELIEDGVDGFLYEYENSGRLSEILLKLRDAKEIRKKMIKEFEKKLELFDIEYMVKKYIRLYNMLLTDH